MWTIIKLLAKNTILPFIKAYWKQILIALAAAYILFVVFYQVPHLKAERDKYKDQVSFVKDANQKLYAGIELQNKSIEDMRKVSLQQQKAFDKLQGQIDKSQKQAQDAVNSILGAQDKIKTCQQAIDSLVDTAQGKSP